MPGNQAVKSTARAILHKNWPQLIFCTFSLIACVFVGLYAQSVLSLLMGRMALFAVVPFIILYALLVCCPLFLGVLRFVWRVIIEGDGEIKSVFCYFSNASRYLKSVHFSFAFGVRIILSAFLAYLPNIALHGAYSLAGDFIGEGSDMHFMFLSAILSLFGLVLFIVFSVRFYISPLLFIGGERLEVAEVLHLSKLISRQTAGSYIILIIGMLGWILISVLGITLIYTVPYILIAYAVHCRYAVYHYNKRVKITGETDFPEYRSSF